MSTVDYEEIARTLGVKLVVPSRAKDQNEHVTGAAYPKAFVTLGLCPDGICLGVTDDMEHPRRRTRDERALPIVCIRVPLEATTDSVLSQLMSADGKCADRRLNGDSV